MAEQVGGIYYEVDARTGNLIRSQRTVSQSTKGIQRDFERTERSGQRLNTTMTRLAKTIGGVFAARQIQQFIVGTARAIDEQNNFAQAIGVSFDQLQRLQFVTAQNGATTQEFNNSLRRLARRAEEASKGTGSAVSAFEELGINAKELQGLAPDEIFLRVADSFKELETSGQQTRVAFGLFDTEGAKLINTLRRGRGEIERTAASLDNVVSAEAAQAASDFNNEMNRLQRAVGAAGGQLAGELLPAMTDFIDRLTDIVNDGETVGRIISGIGIAAQAAAVIFAGRFVGAIAASASGMTAATFAANTLRFALSALGGPVGVVAAVAAGMVLLSRNARKAEEDLQNQELQVGNLTKKYKELDEAQRDSIRTSIEQQRTAALARIAQLEEIDVLERAQQARRASGGDIRGRRPSQDRAAGEREINELIERQNRLLQRLENQEKALNDLRDESNDKVEESTEATNRGSDSFEELRDTLVNAQRELQSTNDEWEEYQVLQKLGADATKEQREEILALLAGMRQLREEEEARRKAEAAAESDLGLTRLQAREQQFQQELELLQLANEQGIESKIDYEERITELTRQYAEDRKQIIEDETETWKDRLDSVGFSFDSLVNQGVGGLASVAAGFQSGSDAARSFAQSVLTQALGALIRLALQSTIMKGKEVGEAAAAGAAITAAYTPAAVAANIASFGGAGVAAASSAGLAAGATTAAIQTASIGTGRLYGGGVEPGKLYPFMEDGRPEVVTANGKDYLFSPNRAQVTGNRDMDGMGGGANLNLSVIVNEAEGTSTTVSQQGSGMDRQVILDVVRTDIESYGTSTFGAMQKVSDLKAKTQY